MCLRAKKIIVSSEYLKRVITQFGVPKEDIVVIYNAYDPVPMHETKEEIRQRRGISGFTRSFPRAVRTVERVLGRHGGDCGSSERDCRYPSYSRRRRGRYEKNWKLRHAILASER